VRFVTNELFFFFSFLPLCSLVMGSSSFLSFFLFFLFAPITRFKQRPSLLSRELWSILSFWSTLVSLNQGKVTFPSIQEEITFPLTIAI
ncbi:Defensin-like family protein, putative, partial [Theobroma cacao]